MTKQLASTLRVGDRVSVPVCGVPVQGSVTALVGAVGVTIMWDDGVLGSLDFRDMADVTPLPR